MHGLLFMPFKCINKLMELNMVCYYHGSVNKRKAERRCLSTLKTFFSLLAVNQTDFPLPPHIIVYCISILLVCILFALFYKNTE